MKSGFTLLEISIVLVVVGLIVGGIIAGKGLMESAELTSVLSNVEKNKIAVETFKDQYHSLPGDIPDISVYFAGLINGDGDFTIDYNLGTYAEEYYAWRHLTRAGLITGNFDGEPSSLPESGFSGGFFRLSYQTNVYGIDGHMLSLNAFGSGSTLAHYAVLTPQQAYSLDKKADDGEADAGEILTFNPTGVPGCITNYYPAGSGDYILSNEDVLCKMFFRFEF